MRKPTFITVIPSDLRFLWELECQLHNFRKYGYTEGYRVLVFIPFDRVDKPLHDGWKELQDTFKEVVFSFYKDDGSCLKLIKDLNYISILRPWCLYKHFTEYPELSKEILFYTDTDVLFVREFPFDKFMQDDICYLSLTGKAYKNGNYLDINYFDGKVSNIRDEKLEEYNKLDVVDNLAKRVGISRTIIEENNSGTGGAQYLIKNIDAQFWNDVLEACKVIRPYLQVVNQAFFKGENPIERENNGFQSWCADMWAVLWNLWKRGYKTECPEEMNFAWATDPIEVLDKTYIFHNAGVTDTTMELNGVKEVVFCKTRLAYVNNIIKPQQDIDYLNRVTSKYCTRFYADALLEVNNINNIICQQKEVHV